MNKTFAFQQIRQGVNPVFITLILLATLIVCGCSDPLLDPQFYTESQQRRLREISILNLPKADEKTASEPAKKTPPPKELALTLEEARAFALQYNLDLKVTLIRPAIANQSISEAEAQFELLIFSNINWSKTDTPVDSALNSSSSENLSGNLGLRVPLRTGGTITLEVPVNKFETDNVFSTLNPSYTADFSASISQPLLRGGGIRANTHAIRIAHYQSLESQARTKLEVISVLAQVDRVYWRLFATRAALKVRKQEHDLAVKQVERAQRQVNAGTVAEIEVIRAQAAVAERLEAIITSDNLVRDWERQLKRVINKPTVDIGSPTVLIPSTWPIPTPYELDGNQLADSAVKNRMEMLELELQMARNISSIDFEKNRALPLVNLTYRYNVNGLGSSESGALDVLSDRNFEDHRVGLQMEMPLGNEAAKSRVRQAIAVRLQTISRKAQRDVMIRQEVFNAKDQIETNWQRILASRQRRLLAERTLKAEVSQFDQGKSTSTDVLDAQTNLAQAKLSEIVAHIDYQIAQVDLAFATGTLIGAAKVRIDPIEPEFEKKYK